MSTRHEQGKTKKTWDFHTSEKYGVLDGPLTKFLAFFKVLKASQKSKSGFEAHFWIISAE